MSSSIRWRRISALVGFRLTAMSVVRRLEGIEPLLRPVEMLAWPGLLVLVDLRGRAGAHHVRDGVRAEEDQPAVGDLERVAVERADGRTGDPVSLRVVLAAVARAPVTGGNDRLEPDLPVLRVLVDRRLAEDRP